MDPETKRHLKHLAYIWGAVALAVIVLFAYVSASMNDHIGGV